MQFIDFTKDAFRRPDNTNKFLLDIPRDEVGFAEIDIHKKTDNDSYEEADYEVIDDLDKITIIMRNPADIRVKYS
ncbi:hypothetical protein [Epilithonimonas zeae]|uniref:hypothetical protein n=1 Tax=Epilithonimonas zeae TaxID=1416779 RepID=UPI00200EE164|nr:hypothetical protein [Epilithonimonas zeae]UQB69331.1 hypothetical protein KI430_02550 [Epilithonimonas zeae]